MILKRSFQRLQKEILNQIKIISEENNIYFYLGLPHFCHFDVILVENYKVYYIEDKWWFFASLGCDAFGQSMWTLG